MVAYACVHARHHGFAVTRVPLRAQVRNGTCRDVDFPQFAARPYTLAIQDRLFGCHNADHDFAHVETQASCLKADGDGFATDYLVRHVTPILNKHAALSPSRIICKCCPTLLAVQNLAVYKPWRRRV